MAAIDEINARLDEFVKSSLIGRYDIIEGDDSIRVRAFAAKGQDVAKVKDFIVDALSGLLSVSQVSVEESAG